MNYNKIQLKDRKTNIGEIAQIKIELIFASTKKKSIYISMD